MRMFPPECPLRLAGSLARICADHARQRAAKRERTASKRNGILSTELVSKGELHMSAVDPERHIAVLNESREEIFKVAAYSKP